MIRLTRPGIQPVFYFFLLLAVFGAFFSCATSIVNKEIMDIQMEIMNQKENRLIPENSYRVSLKAYYKNHTNGISSFRHDELRLTSRSDLVELQPASSTIITDFRFSLLGKSEVPGYHWIITVPGNAYGGSEYSFPVRWGLGDSYRITGDGGQPRMLGGYGGNGGNGPNLDVEVAGYDVTGTPLEGTGDYLLVHIPGRDLYTLVNRNEAPFDIWSKGGDGEDGSDGASRSTRGTDLQAYGENGSDGGHGGDGGIIRFITPAGSTGMDRLFRFDVSGGAGGNGGLGGRGEDKRRDPTFFEAVSGVNRGDSGRDGRDGRKGQVIMKESSLENMFRTIEDPDFDRSRLTSGGD